MEAGSTKLITAITSFITALYVLYKTIYLAVKKVKKNTIKV